MADDFLSIGFKVFLTYMIDPPPLPELELVCPHEKPCNHVWTSASRCLFSVSSQVSLRAMTSKFSTLMSAISSSIFGGSSWVHSEGAAVWCEARVQQLGAQRGCSSWVHSEGEAVGCTARVHQLGAQSNSSSQFTST